MYIYISINKKSIIRVSPSGGDLGGDPPSLPGKLACNPPHVPPLF